MQNTELKIESGQRQNPDSSQQKLYAQRGDWETYIFTSEQKVQLHRWICDHADYLPGFQAWNVKIVGRRGYLFCEYDRNLGFEGIEFHVRRPRASKGDR